MSKKDILTEKGKELAFLLRHDQEAFDAGKIDNAGWRKISELCTVGYTVDLIDKIVKTNNKKRYEYNDDKSCIRACQGHSINVDVNLKEMTPPYMLYHGTASRFIDSINEKGIISMGRLYVHLSDNKDTALAVGKRHGKPIFIVIDAKRMYEDGCKFYLSNNGVWLTEKVDPKYFLLTSNTFI